MLHVSCCTFVLLLRSKEKRVIVKGSLATHAMLLPRRGSSVCSASRGENTRLPARGILEPRVLQRRLWHQGVSDSENPRCLSFLLISA